MGQRLNIEIVSNDKTIANCYYHWDAFSSVAFGRAKEMLKFITEHKEYFKEDDRLFFAIRIFEAFGAGMDELEYAIARVRCPKYEFYENEDRVAGLISISEQGINETRLWEEGRVTINLDDESIDFDCFMYLSDENLEEMQFQKEVNLEIDPHIITKEDVEYFSNFLYENSNNCFTIQDDKENKYAFIE